jgi:hypothetical protein
MISKVDFLELLDEFFKVRKSLEFVDDFEG